MITILEYVYYKRPWLKEQEAVDMKEFEALGVPIMGSCAICGATISAHNACFGRQGYLIGTCCADEGSVYTKAAEVDALFEEDANVCHLDG